MSFAHVRLGIVALAFSLTACVSIGMPVGEAPEQKSALESWSRVLDSAVDSSGRVDFASLAANRVDLDRYVGYVAKVDPVTDPLMFPSADARLAHYLNAYNSLSMYGVVRLGIPRTNAGLRKIGFFFLRRYEIGGRKQSLYTFEKGIRDLGDPRVHFALNCMSVSCPTLPREPFPAEGLQARLDAEARAFFGSEKHLRLDAQRKVVSVSQILEFYTDDFLKVAPSLIDYINRYRDVPIPADYTVEFIPYDWTINRQPAKG